MRAFMSSAAIFFMLSIASLAEAEIRHVYQSGQHLIDNCDMGAKTGVDSWIPGGICMGYVSAISDMLNTFEDWGYWNSKKVCIEKPGCAFHYFYFATRSRPQIGIFCFSDNDCSSAFV